jgi:hypothetical protein
MVRRKQKASDTTTGRASFLYTSTMKSSISCLALIQVCLLAGQGSAFVPLRTVSPERRSAFDSVHIQTSVRPSQAPSLPRHVLFMGWGPDPIWSSATVKASDSACASGNSLMFQVDVSPDTAAEYKVPGESRVISWRSNAGRDLFDSVLNCCVRQANMCSCD